MKHNTGIAAMLAEGHLLVASPGADRLQSRDDCKDRETDCLRSGAAALLEKLRELLVRHSLAYTSRKFGRCAGLQATLSKGGFSPPPLPNEAYIAIRR